VPHRARPLGPGLWAGAGITRTERAAALVVPADSVQTGPQGQYVYVVAPDMTAELRPVTLDRIDGASAIIATGLKRGESIVTQGQLRLGPGAKVTVRAKPEAS